jgi:pilus assembly protein CpaB
MNKRFVAVLIFAFIVATGASMTLYRLTSNRAQAAVTPPPTTKLVLAAKDLEVGSIVREGDVVLKDWAGEAPPSAAQLLPDVLGRGVITKIYAKEAILENRLAPKGAGGGFAATIPQGMRAVAVPVNEVVGVAGFAVAGMHVDVIISGTPPNGTGGLGTQSKTLLQNIEVLSAGQDFKKDAEGKPVAVQVVNLLVTPEQAEELSLASHQTTIQLVLRNPLDRDVAKTPGVALGQLFGAKAKPVSEAAVAPVARLRPHPAKTVAPAPEVAVAPTPPPVKKEEPFVMEIISGNKKNQAKFEPGEDR